jgi:hypothetical protein
MRASEYQRLAEARLKGHFDDVRVEWSVVNGASGVQQRAIHRYAPRVDIAIGPFNTTPGPDSQIDERLLPRRLRQLFSDRPRNPNPRCLLAIEIVFSGSPKHIMGDTLNAGALGLYGLASEARRGWEDSKDREVLRGAGRPREAPSDVPQRGVVGHGRV